jgi:uncharacterized membrane protein YfcA
LSLGIYSRFKKELGQQERPSHRDPLGWVIGGFVLFLLGIFNGSLTAGSGLVVTLFLVLWFGFSYKQAVALTLVCVGLFWNGMGAIAIVNVGIDPHWPWVPILLVSSFLGGWLGAIATHRLPNSVIKIAFEVLTIKLIYSAWLSQELLHTFSEEIETVSLHPDTGGCFEIHCNGVYPSDLKMLVSARIKWLSDKAPI